MLFFVDQIDEDIATLIFEEQEINIPLSLLPNSIEEGDYLNVIFTLNKKDSTIVKENVETLIKELSNENTGEDFDL